MRWSWHLAKFLTRVAAAATWQIRPKGAEHVPKAGGVLLAANHQSYLDPLLVSSVVDREIHFMARSSLFGIPGFGRLIVAYNAFPVERDSGDVKGVKTAIERLRAGNVLLVFPEGTRTRDGRIGPMKSGIRLLAERADVPVVPVLIEGAHRVWPRGRAWPGLRGRIDLQFAPPLRAVRGTDLGERVREAVVGLKRILARELRREFKETAANVESKAGA